MATQRRAAELPPGFAEMRRAETVVVLRANTAEALADAGLLDSPEAASGAHPLNAGRGGAWATDVEGLGPVVVRPGRRGGVPGRFLRRRYFVGRRFVDELVITELLRRRGAPVPVPLAAVERPRRPGYETWLITRRVVSAYSLDEALRDAGLDVETPLARAGRLVARFHRAGGEHADLNAANLLLARGATDTVIDLDRGRLHPGGTPEQVRLRNLARLRRSLVRLELNRALAAWDALTGAYREAWEASSARPGGVAS